MIRANLPDIQQLKASVRHRKEYAMSGPERDRLSSWTRCISAVANAASKLVWTIVALLIITTLGHYLYSRTQPERQSGADRRTQTAIQKPIPWHEVDAAIVGALKSSHTKAEDTAKARLAEWTGELQKRIDDDFLKWYFSYWQQQWMGLKAIGYWLADSKAVEKITGEQPSMAERITEEIQEEFSKRVLRPQIAQLQMERIAEEVVSVFVGELQKNLAPIPEKYHIPQAEWDRYLEDMAVLTSHVEGNRQVTLPLKAVTAVVAGGVTVAAVKLTQMLKPVIAKIGTKMTTKAAAEGAGKAAATVATQTGGKVASMVGGKFLGAIVGVGIIVWDVWDHQHTKKIESPILRQNLADYLTELQQSLLYEPETGLMTIVHGLETNIVGSLKHTPPSSGMEPTR
jgi:hypothetical protein